MTAPAVTAASVTSSGSAPVKATIVEGTEYVILSKADDGYWNIAETNIVARSTEAAIRAHGKPGTYIAIPARSFRPVTVKAETTTVLKLEAAK